MECLTFTKMVSGYNMSRNDVVMTPLRVKQAIDSRFVKPSEDELNVLINGTWVEFVKVGGEPEPDGWYDTLGFTEFALSASGASVNTNEVQYTDQEMLNILPFHVKWNGTFTKVETGDVADSSDIIIDIRIDEERIKILPADDYERIIQSSDLPDLSDKGFYTFSLHNEINAQAQGDTLIDGYFEFRENDANGVVIGHYPLHSTLKSACYLTSAMVGYYGMLDDGVELTAMRQLREVYAEKHAETLKTYYEDSAIIITEIKRLGMQDYYYGRIKDVVDEIVIHVENENWNTAEVLYLDLYYGLKEELM